MTENSESVAGAVEHGKRDIVQRAINYASSLAQAAEKSMRDHSGDLQASAYHAGKSDAFDIMMIYLTGVLTGMNSAAESSNS